MFFDLYLDEIESAFQPANVTPYDCSSDGEITEIRA